MAQAFFVLNLPGTVVAYTLNSLVVYLDQLRIPRVTGTVIVMAGLMGAVSDSTAPAQLATHVVIVKVDSEPAEHRQPVAKLPGE